MILMARSDSERPEESTGTSPWRRLGKLIYEWLRLLSCLSGYVYFDTGDYKADAPFRSTWALDSERPDLQTQLESLFDCVWRQERIWRLENRTRGSGP